MFHPEKTEPAGDVIVVGAGHAGCEAALACARLGLRVLLFTTSVDAIAMMPCNPNIGGTSKGHLVREVDALGGEMGKVIDRTFLQSKMLNRSKGPAVHSLRAQADKAAYARRMRQVLDETPNLEIVVAEVSGILTDASESRCCGVRAADGREFAAAAVVLCTGVYLNARCLTGEDVRASGPSGLSPATELSASLLRLGLRLARFKTGTPARVDRRTVDFSKLQEEPGDVPVIPFSFSTDPAEVQIEQLSCYLTYTTEETHRIIRENLHRSPMHTGVIAGTGPRYCPSIEDKVTRFAEADRHQVFLEPEGRDADEIYVDGMSSALPADVQEAMYHSVPGLEHAKILKYAYAIEYDCLDPRQLRPTLELREVPGLFAAGQMNGSSGYEEAAAQGLLAGINAAMKVLGREPLVLDRSEAYIGVLIDDLVTQGTNEPYRMMTSRAEYRLLLRQDNADLRLRGHGHRVGLISDEEMARIEAKKQRIADEIARVERVVIRPGQEENAVLTAAGSAPLNTGCTLAELLRRPELTYSALANIDPTRPELPADVREQVEINVKYEGYIQRQERQVEQFRKQEAQRIPEDIDYAAIGNLRIEARQKLAAQRPANIGQASRISGVSPADIAVLLVYLKKKSAEENEG